VAAHAGRGHVGPALGLEAAAELLGVSGGRGAGRSVAFDEVSDPRGDDEADGADERAEQAESHRPSRFRGLPSRLFITE
jgi:hypothetical protein